MNEKQQISLLSKLAEDAINRLKSLPQPVVRVCGPLTTGGVGYDENLRRFKLAESALRKRGYTVFDYFDSSDDEEQIKRAEIPWEMVMEHYHAPILRANLMAKAFFMPGSEASTGTMWEKDFIKKYTTTEVAKLPEEWIEAEKGAK